MKMYVACRAGSLPPSDLCCPSAHACLLLSRFYWCFGPFSNRVLPGPGSVCCCCMINSVLLLYRRRCRRRRSRISFVLFALWFSLPEFTFFLWSFFTRLFPRFRGLNAFVHIYCGGNIPLRRTFRSPIRDQMSRYLP